MNWALPETEKNMAMIEYLEKEWKEIWSETKKTLKMVTLKSTMSIKGRETEQLRTEYRRK